MGVLPTLRETEDSMKLHSAGYGLRTNEQHEGRGHDHYPECYVQCEGLPREDRERWGRGSGYCPHGVYVGGMGIDWMCHTCEMGWEYCLRCGDGLDPDEDGRDRTMPLRYQDHCRECRRKLNERTLRGLQRLSRAEGYARMQTCDGCDGYGNYFDASEGYYQYCEQCGGRGRL